MAAPEYLIIDITTASAVLSGTRRAVPMGDYEIVIHMREPDLAMRIPLPGLSAQLAEADRESLKYQIEEARRAEAPIMPIQTPSGHPAAPQAIDPHLVTEIDLVELSADDVDD